MSSTMQITRREITVAELIAGYEDKDDAEHDYAGVTGYGGRLDIRPPYQREFVYGEKAREAVIDTVRKGYPLNVMYWAVREDGTYEIIDGQQRTISICQYVHGDFPYRGDFFGKGAMKHVSADILSYKLTIYLCEGDENEKLDWFETINIAGATLTPQELRNAVYGGVWVNDAKKYFSKRGSAAQRYGEGLIKGSSIRQEHLETALKWITNNGSIKEYMSKHQHDENATPLRNHFEAVIDWVRETFLKPRKPMKGLNWGRLYDKYHTHTFDPVAFEEDIVKLTLDRDVDDKSGIYEYLLSGRKAVHLLHLRDFSEDVKEEKYEEQHGICANYECPNRDRQFDLADMDADHIQPWSKGGPTTVKNCQLLCRECNGRKGNR